MSMACRIEWRGWCSGKDFCLPTQRFQIIWFVKNWLYWCNSGRPGKWGVLQYIVCDLQIQNCLVYHTWELQSMYYIIWLCKCFLLVLQSSRKILRSNEIVVRPSGLIDAELNLSFSLQVSNSVIPIGVLFSYWSGEFCLPYSILYTILQCDSEVLTRSVVIQIKIYVV